MRLLLALLLLPSVALADYDCRRDYSGGMRCTERPDINEQWRQEKIDREEREHRALEAEYYRSQLEPKPEPLSDHAYLVISRMIGARMKAAKTEEEKKRIAKETLQLFTGRR